MTATRRTLWTTLAILACSLPALAAAWTPYGNPRFEYWIDLPPGFSQINESVNGDGGRSSSAEGNAELLVWGSYLSDRSFAAETAWRADQDRSDGWSLTYQKQQPKWAVWSGAKGERIFYERAIPVCAGAAAYFRIEYDKSSAKTFDPIVANLSKSLRSGKCQRRR